MTKKAREALIQAFAAVTEMWGRRYDTETEAIPDPKEGEPFGCPVAVDVGHLSTAQSSLLVLVGELLPDLYEKMKTGGVPDAPLPPPEGKVISLDKHRIRVEEEFLDEQVAYVEALWGRNTFAFNVAVRDLERMRRGGNIEDKSLRIPETYYEAQHMILHVRALANDLARHFSMPDQVREGDDLREPPKPTEE